ncbi:glycosyltransferase family 2 protein [Burkholderia multivorans]|uniref:glycosyltransferase family 2 protein n=1 Tax=Burkholderia multivorans TaxID=87883 RepID=UPI00075B3772|nr:glycosyltransferase family 2 protein [Burkholderia multivorans]AYY96511.1 glycosyltransferase family 2 protein [Burkholderia multivorans]KWF65312.1 rhamnosyltransferase [Burkholderia multivorans]KWF73258.1 rhamnosyltransferase [Burkholderia multivorans]MBU9120356.1 glycosyltransferase family 2 protein [Burkholderia multivorans]MBU9605463.1 glycosyltransferase family 2 protein [Burkholderia multivorans]
MSAGTATEGEVGIVVVFYRPDSACILRANRMAAAGHRVVIVDNSESVRTASEMGLDPRIEYLANGCNLGIATALNQGIARLLASGCAYAILFDQDSEPSPVLLAGLPKLLESACLTGRRVAIIGPAYQDARLGGIAPFVRFGYFRLERIPPAGVDPIDVDFLITSGSCVNLREWDAIGPMDDSLFIDFVDLEWCVRAKAKGYAVLGAPGLRLVHELGGVPVCVLGRRYPGHSPLRHYYMFRNAIALVRRKGIPWSWKSTELVKLPVRLLIYGLFMTPRREHLRLSLLGIWHGLTGKLGALSQN